MIFNVQVQGHDLGGPNMLLIHGHEDSGTQASRRGSNASPTFIFPGYCACEYLLSPI